MTEKQIERWPLPRGWTWAAFEDVANIAQDLVAPKEVLDLPHIAPNHIGSGNRQLLPYTTVRADAVISAKQRFFPGQILFTKIRPYLLKSVLVDFEGVCSADMYPLWTKDTAEPKYLLYWLTSPDFRDEIASQQGRTVLPKINQAALNRSMVAVPPLAEQRRIVGKIEGLSGKSRRASESLDRIPRLVEKYKQAILAAAFRGDLTKEWRKIDPRETWSQDQLSELEKRRKEYLQDRRGSRLRLPKGAATIPPGWFEAHLSDVGSLQVGYAYKSKWYSKHGIPLLRGANIAPGKVTWDDIVQLPSDRAADFSKYTLNTGDIVIAMDRPIISTGLKVARIEPSDAGCLLVQRVARYVPSAFLENGFAWHLINSQLFIDHAVTQATGSDLPHISSNDILTTSLPLPVLTEQQEIVRLIEKAFSWIDRLASETNSARKLIDHLDQAILVKAFRGELVPQDPNDEPASGLLARIKAGRVVGKRKKVRNRKTAA